MRLLPLSLFWTAWTALGRVPRRRQIAHGLMLAGVSLLVLAGAAVPRDATTSVLAAPAAGRAELGGGGPIEAVVPVTPDWLRAGGAGSTRIVPPEWVRSTVESGFWSGPDDRAVLFNSLPESTNLKPMGPYVNGRLLVYFAGDDSTRAAGQGWIDVAAVEPSTPPVMAAATPRPAEVTFSLKPLPSPPLRVSTAPPPAVTAGYLAVVDEATGQLLYGEGERQRAAPASVTKIATTIVALERATSLAQIIPVTVSGAEMSAADGSSVMGLERGDRVTVETLLYGMMLPSGNDAAEQIALGLGGSRERYVGWMNQRVQALGLKDTRFVNPSGMDAPGQYSSAYDLAILARYAMQNAEFRKIVAAPYYMGDGYPLRNINRLIGSYPGADGVKVGFTDAARKTIVASATRNGRRVYVSLLRSEDLPGDSAALFDWVWSSFRW